MRKFKLWNRDKTSYIDLNNQNHFATDWQGLGLGYDLTFSESDNGRYVNNQTISQKDITATLVFTGNAYANYDIIRQFILKNNGRCVLEYEFESADTYNPWEMNFFLDYYTLGYHYICYTDIDFSNAYIPTFPKVDDEISTARNFTYYSYGVFYITIERPIIEAIMAKYDVNINDAFKIYMQENQYRAYVPTTRTIYRDVIVQELPKAEKTRYNTLESNIKLTPESDWYKIVQYTGTANENIIIECKYPNTPIYLELSNLNINDFSVHLLGDIYATEIHFNANLTSDLTLVIDSINRKIYTKFNDRFVENWYQYIDHNLDAFLIMPQPGYYTVNINHTTNEGNVIITIREMV